MPSPLLSVKDLTVTLNDHLILNHISFQLHRHETLAVIGPNGAGKSILLRALLGFVPYQGTIKWHPRIKIGYVPQKLSVAHDLPLTTKEFFSFKTHDLDQISLHLSHVGFSPNRNPANFHQHILNNRLGNLSGGELQRVLIAWALIDQPDVLLFDEPTSGIDISSEQTIYQLIHSLETHHQLTMILISHELQIVYRYATNVLCLNQQSLCYGPPRKILKPDNLEKLFGQDTSYYLHHQH